MLRYIMKRYPNGSLKRRYTSEPIRPELGEYEVPVYHLVSELPDGRPSVRRSFAPAEGPEKSCTERCYKRVRRAGKHDLMVAPQQDGTVRLVPRPAAEVAEREAADAADELREQRIAAEMEAQQRQAAIDALVARGEIS